MEKNIYLKFTGFSGFLLPILSLFVFLISLYYSPWFNITDNAISDFGLPDWAGNFFNYGIMIIGLLLFVFTIGLLKLFYRYRAQIIMIMLSSIFLIFVGVFPLPSNLHIYVSGMFFVAFPIGFFTLGYSLYKKKIGFYKKMGFIALINSFIAIISLIPLLIFSGIAISEIMIIIPGFFWCMIFGLFIIRVK